MMKAVTVAAAGFTILFYLLYRHIGTGVFLSLAITCGTVLYHFLMRLSVGFLFNTVMRNKANYRAKWFCVSAAEQKLYQKLKVKQWKSKLPSYDPTIFDPALHSWDEIAQAMCQAELVHETIAVLSFLPIFAARWFGDLPVFILTSVAAAAFDLCFVVMQRFNRPRVLRMVDRERAAQKGK